MVARNEGRFYTRDDAKVEAVWSWFKTDVLGVRSEKDTLFEKTIEELRKKILEEEFQDIFSSTDEDDLKLLGELVSRKNIYDCITDITDIEECKNKLGEYQDNALKSLRDRINSEREKPTFVEQVQDQSKKQSRGSSVRL